VFRGRVQSCKDGRSVVETRTARALVWWAGGVLPPDVYIDQEVMGVAKLKTFDNGRSFQLSDALPLSGESWSELMEPIFQRLFMFAGDPAEWCPKEVIDMYRRKRGWKKSKPSYPNKPPA
jgi:hypothetical protein